MPALRSEVARQLGRLAESFHLHRDHHERFRTAMVPVREEITAGSRATWAEINELKRDTDREVLETFDGIRRDRVEAFEDWNDDWRDAHFR